MKRMIKSISAGIGVWVVLLIIVKNSNPLLSEVEIFAQLGSFIAAIATVLLYIRQGELKKQQNDIISKQTRATTQSRKASIQTLDVGPGDSPTYLKVEVSNSGGGPADNLTGIVQFHFPQEINIEINRFEAPVQRRSLSADRTQEEAWNGSYGNTIAAGEQRVPIEIQCSARFGAEEYGFPKAVREITEGWKVAQLQRLTDCIPQSVLENEAEVWDKSWLYSLASGELPDDLSAIDIQELYEIVTTAATNSDAVEIKDVLLSDSITMSVCLRYKDAYLESIGEDATKDVSVINIPFEMGENVSLEDVLISYKPPHQRSGDSQKYDLEL